MPVAPRDMVQMPPAKQEDLLQTFPLDALNEPLAALLKFGDVLGSGLTRIPLAFKAATNSLVDFVTQSGAEDLVLILQILNVFRQFAVRPGGDQSEQGMKNLRHGRIVRTSDSGANCTFVVPRLGEYFRGC